MNIKSLRMRYRRKGYSWNGQGVQRVKITGGEFSGQYGTVQGQLPHSYAIGTPRSRFMEDSYRILIDGFPKPGGWNGIAIVAASMLEKS